MTAFNRPTRVTLVTRDRNDLNARIAGADSNLRRTLLNGIATMHGGAMDGAYGYLDWIADQVMPDSADAAHLIRWASIWGVFQKQPSAASGTAQTTGVSTNGLTVPAGTIIQRGDLLTYHTTADAVVAGGVVDAPIAAVIPGSAGNTLAGTVLTTIAPIAGISSTWSVDADITNGTDIETPAELLARLLFRIQNAPKGGAPGDYVEWATSQPGVTRAWEFPLWNGLGTVGVAFVYDDRVNIFPLAGDVTAVQTFLNSVAPNTAAVTPFAPLNDAVNFTIHLNPDSTALRAAVTAELADLFTREATPGGVILQSHYDQAIGAAVGAGDYTVVAPVGNIAPAAYTLATLGVISW